MRRFVPRRMFLVVLLCSMEGMQSLFAFHLKDSAAYGTTKGLIPASIGNIWIYESKIYDPIKNTHTIELDTLRIDTTIFQSGCEWFVIANYEHLPIGPYLLNRSDGLWSIDDKNQAPYMEFAYPAASGMKYQAWNHTDTNSHFLNGSWVTITVVSTNDTVITQTGTFSCYHYSYNYEAVFTEGDVSHITPLDYDMYFAPGIGLVKVTRPNNMHYMSDSTDILVSTLMSYKIQ